ncbi:NAD(P)-dependent alcohol dehydrogenase [Sphingomonas phyllosphaerae]|uniref:NAD(P)-dependent alcohol dehydrogenase n=1 Tax=Sphingomonas phyllosphaerae TaxID=257003 RepID=UPI000414D4BD|nr:NAD(P)-dependent alcohol dehydrogenase [Sphingomonas phyllosphaerae]
MIKALGYAAKHSFSRLKPLEFERHEAGADEVEIDVLYCGVCHSDVHQAENDWGNTVYPCVPGHEIVGRVTNVGGSVSQHAVGDLVGVGCMIDSCQECSSCHAGEEQYCEGPNAFLATYNGPMKPAAMAKTGTNMYGRDNTYGGYSTSLTVKDKFVLKIPAALPVEAAAPILCAGVTTYSPLRHWKVKSGDKVGIVGLGGLGDMAVKLARAMGAEVTVFTTTKEKIAEAEKLGTRGVLQSDKDAMEALEAQFDFILSTIPEGHKVDPFIPLLKRDGSYVAVGALAQMPGYSNQQLIMGRKTLSGSSIGGIAETQEVLDFCAEHGVAPDIQIIPIQEINEAYKKVKSGDVRFRYVIDMASLKQEMADA